MHLPNCSACFEPDERTDLVESYPGPERPRASRRLVKRGIAFALLCSQLLTGCAAAATRLPPPVPEQERPLQVGDIVRIDGWRQPEYSGEFVVGAGGGLVHPLDQETQIAGLPISGARDRISAFLAGYLQGARLVVEPLYSVSVAGEVREPNVYHVGRGTTVAQAIAQAGGPTTQAQLDRILLVRGSEQYPLNLGEKLTSFGNIPVVSGDQVLVYRTSSFSVWRDVVAPVGTPASLVVAIIRISDKTGGVKGTWRHPWAKMGRRCSARSAGAWLSSYRCTSSGANWLRPSRT